MEHFGACPDCGRDYELANAAAFISGPEVGELEKTLAVAF